jgi:hypothetical protein
VKILKESKNVISHSPIPIGNTLQKKKKLVSQHKSVEKNTEEDWRYGSSDKVLVQQAQDHEFNTQYYLEKKKKDTFYRQLAICYAGLYFFHSPFSGPFR